MEEFRSWKVVTVDSCTNQYKTFYISKMSYSIPLDMFEMSLTIGLKHVVSFEKSKKQGKHFKKIIRKNRYCGIMEIFPSNKDKTKNLTFEPFSPKLFWEARWWILPRKNNEKIMKDMKYWKMETTFRREEYEKLYRER